MKKVKLTRFMLDTFFVRNGKTSKNSLLNIPMARYNDLPYEH
ncbi:MULTISPECIES: hypothetical protein [Bacillus cereus group]|nr:MULTISPECIES: hypothetical protein [Bacillus cereus group]